MKIQGPLFKKWGKVPINILKYSFMIQYLSCPGMLHFSCYLISDSPGHRDIHRVNVDNTVTQEPQNSAYMYVYLWLLAPATRPMYHALASSTETEPDMSSSHLPSPKPTGYCNFHAGTC